MSLGILLLAPSVKADAFTFSFSNNEGDIDGAVTGEIVGLTNNTAAQAADVIITSYTGFTSEDDSLLGATPIDTSSWTAEQNIFTETDGEITFADFSAVEVFPSFFGAEDFFRVAGANAELEVSFPNGPSEVEDNVEYGAPPAITFTPVTATPEPSSIVLLGGALLLLTLGGLHRRKAA